MADTFVSTIILSLQEDAIAYYLAYWKNEKALLDVIIRNNLVYLLGEQCIHFLLEEDTTFLPFLDTPRLKADEFVLAGFVNLQITLIMQWYMQNFSTPLEEMVNTYQRLLYQPLITRESAE